MEDGEVRHVHSELHDDDNPVRPRRIGEFRHEGDHADRAGHRSRSDDPIPQRLCPRVDFAQIRSGGDVPRPAQDSAADEIARFHDHLRPRAEIQAAELREALQQVAAERGRIENDVRMDADIGEVGQQKQIREREGLEDDEHADEAVAAERAEDRAIAGPKAFSIGHRRADGQHERDEGQRESDQRPDAQLRERHVARRKNEGQRRPCQRRGDVFEQLARE
jgi:hypothetical protein